MTTLEKIRTRCSGAVSKLWHGPLWGVVLVLTAGQSEAHRQVSTSCWKGFTKHIFRSSHLLQSVTSCRGYTNRKQRLSVAWLCFEVINRIFVDTDDQGADRMLWESPERRTSLPTPFFSHIQACGFMLRWPLEVGSEIKRLTKAFAQGDWKVDTITTKEIKAILRAEREGKPISSSGPGRVSKSKRHEGQPVTVAFYSGIETSCAAGQLLPPRPTEPV